MVNIMKIKACSVIISTWNTAQPKCNGNWYMPSNAISMKISSPANMLPNNRSDSEIGLAISATDSSTKLNAMMTGAAIRPKPLVGGAIGCSVNSRINPPTPLFLIV